MHRDEFFGNIMVANTIGIIKLALLAGIPKDKFSNLGLSQGSYNSDYLPSEALSIMMNETFCISQSFHCCDEDDFEEMSYWVAQIDPSHSLELTDEHMGFVVLDDRLKDFDITFFEGGSGDFDYYYAEAPFEAYLIDRGYVILCDTSYGYPNMLDFANEFLGVYMKVIGRENI